MDYKILQSKTKDYALEYFKTHHSKILIYHKKEHTEQVVERVAEIGNHYQLNELDFFIVSVSAWFHDLGYLTNFEHHEEQGAQLAGAFFKNNGLEDSNILLVRNCILATKMPQSPVTLLEKIICDADLYNLGTDVFFKQDKLLLEEYRNLHNKHISKLEWRELSIKFLESHHYQTDYCQLLLNKTKEENLEIYKDKIIKGEEKLNSAELKHLRKNDNGGNDKSQSKKSKADRPDKGIETMFRVSSSNHQRLSDMADKKAHIMITVNSIILSALISLVLRRLNEYEYLLPPTIILLAVSLAAMTFSILSTRPTIPEGVFSKEDVEKKQVNLLFFGNFYKMSLPDYNEGMLKMMDDREFLYGSLIKDGYFQGKVLGRKYELLRIAYNIFMFGLIISVVAFIIAVAFFNKK